MRRTRTRRRGSRRPASRSPPGAWSSSGTLHRAQTTAHAMRNTLARGMERATRTLGKRSVMERLFVSWNGFLCHGTALCVMERAWRGHGASDPRLAPRTDVPSFFVLGAQKVGRETSVYEQRSAWASCRARVHLLVRPASRKKERKTYARCQACIKGTLASKAPPMGRPVTSHRVSACRRCGCAATGGWWRTRRRQ
jgi:hypothetical protein